MSFYIKPCYSANRQTLDISSQGKHFLFVKYENLSVTAAGGRGISADNAVSLGNNA